MPLPGQEFFFWLRLGLIVLLVLGVVLTLVWLLGRRGRQKLPSGSPLDRMILLYRLANPSFAAVMSAVREQGLLNDLNRHGDVRAALKLLEEEDRRNSAKPKKDRNSSLLNPSPDNAERVRRSQAAVVTVLRAAYLDERIRPKLPRDAVQEMDRYLDSLTG